MDRTNNVFYLQEWCTCNTRMAQIQILIQQKQFIYHYNIVEVHYNKNQRITLAFMEYGQKETRTFIGF